MGAPKLQSDGSGPVAVYFRLPPDLFWGDRQALPLHLEYRYNAVSLADDSTMRINANGSMISDLPLPHEDDASRELSHNLNVPLVNVHPFSNTFLFNFYFQITRKGNCQDTPPINLQGAVLRSSYISLRGLNHWAAMPNLDLFANAGFPFTRFADLAQTKIVLPASAPPEEISLYLALMAYFGEQAGYPALRVQVGDPASLGRTSITSSSEPHRISRHFRSWIRIFPLPRSPGPLRPGYRRLLCRSTKFLVEGCRDAPGLVVAAFPLQ